MTAEVELHLERPTRLGKTILKKKFYGKKKDMKDIVDAFIYERTHAINLIRVTEFFVRVYNKDKRVIDTWRYKPTYQD